MASLIPRPVRDMIFFPLATSKLERAFELAKTPSIHNPLILGGFFSNRVYSVVKEEKQQLKMELASIPDSLTPRFQKSLMRAINRTALAVLGTLALYKLGVSMALGATIGAAISIPAVAIVGGSWAAYQGITSMIAALATCSFTTGSVTTASFATVSIATGSIPILGKGALLLVGGYLALEKHDLIPFGAAELLMNRPIKQ
jgi:hypothetical protein